MEACVDCQELFRMTRHTIITSDDTERLWNKQRRPSVLDDAIDIFHDAHACRMWQDHAPFQPSHSRNFQQRTPCPYEPSTQELAAINKALDGVNEWDWNVFELEKASNGHPLQVIGLHLLSHWDLVQRFQLDEEKLRAWLAHIEGQYNDTPYHNRVHAADVTQTVHAMIATGGLRDFLTDMEVLAILLAAIVHDVGHDGMNNNYHKNALTDRAIAFNDEAIQENYHMRVFSESIKTRPDIDFFASCPADLYKHVRQQMIHLVLHTDMSKHFISVEQFKTLAETHGSKAEAWKSNNKVLELMAHVLHSSDLSGQAKKMPLAAAWTDRCLQEFFIQGDLEKNKGLPVSVNCDRDSTPVAASQIGFIRSVILPSYQALAMVLPHAQTYVQQVHSNLEYWEQRKEDGDLGDVAR